MGILSYNALLALTFFFVLKWLGILAVRCHRCFFGASYLGGGMLGGIWISLRFGAGFVGLGFRAGTFLGLAAFLSIVALLRKRESRHQSIPADRALLLMGLACAIAAHVIEISFSFPLGTTMLYFYVFLALLFFAGHSLPVIEREDSNAVPVGQPGIYQNDVPQYPQYCSKIRWSHRSDNSHFLLRREYLAGGLLVAAMLATLGFEILRKGSNSTPLQVIIHAFTRLPGSSGAHTGWLVALIIGSGVLCATIWINECHLAIPSTKPWISSIGISLYVAASAAALFWILVSLCLCSINLSLPGDKKSTVEILITYQNLVWLYYGFHAVILLLIAVVLSQRRTLAGDRENPVSPKTILAAIFLALLGFAAVYATNIRSSHAGVFGGHAKSYERSGDWGRQQ